MTKHRLRNLLIGIILGIIVVGFLVWIAIGPQYYGQYEAAWFVGKPITIIAYNLTLPTTADSNNFSVFLINGLTNRGNWFQLGIDTSPQLSFSVDRQLPNGTLLRSSELTPTGNESLSYGDKILLEIYTKNNATILYAKDWNKPNLTEKITFNNSGDYLVEPEPNFRGAFTGLMSEYHYIQWNAQVPHPEILYQPLNYSPHQAVLLLTSKPSILYNVNTTDVQPNQSGAVNLSIYSEYYYPNGTFVTK